MLHAAPPRLLIVAACLLLACTGQPTAQPVAKSEPAAKTEPAAKSAPAASPAAQAAPATKSVGGSFSLYTSVPQNIVNRLQQALKQSQPDLEMQVFRAGTSEVVAKLAAEQRAGSIQADVVWVAEPSTYEEFKRQDLLLKFTPAEADRLSADLKDPDGYYYAGRLINTIIIYNTNLVKTPPKGWQDLTDPAYRGKIGLPTPAASGAAVAFVGALSASQQFGWDYFDKLKENGAQQVANNTQANDKTASGELAVASTLDYMIRELKAKGSPVDGVWPEEGAIFTPSPVGIMAASKNPEPARAFVDYLLSRDGQQTLVEVGSFIPVRSDVEPPQGAPRLQEIKRFPLDWKDIAQREEQIKERFAALFGG